MWIRPGAGLTTTGSYYGASAPDANWVVSQWNTPENLPPFVNGDTGNGSLHVHLEPDHSTTLEQNGSALSCNRTYATGLQSVHEFDLFIGPNNAARPGARAAALGAAEPLASMRHLMHRITVQPISVDVVDTDCRVTRAVFLSAITLRDEESKQTLFYQLRLGMVQAGAGGLVTALPGPFWFARGHDPRAGTNGYFGYDDSVTYYGDAAARVGQTSSYVLDLLPRLTGIIKDGAAFGMDQDLSHWHVGGTYHGEVIWGHVKVRSHWSGFSLAAQE
jgi:hypothetical protein